MKAYNRETEILHRVQNIISITKHGNELNLKSRDEIREIAEESLNYLSNRQYHLALVCIRHAEDMRDIMKHQYAFETTFKNLADSYGVVLKELGLNQYQSHPVRIYKTDCWHVDGMGLDLRDDQWGPMNDEFVIDILRRTSSRADTFCIYYRSHSQLDTTYRLAIDEPACILKTGRLDTSKHDMSYHTDILFGERKKILARILQDYQLSDLPNDWKLVQLPLDDN